MRRGMTMIAALLAAGAAAPAPAAAKARSQRCADVHYERGGGYYVYASRQIRALRVRCSVARRLARVEPEAVRGRGSRRRYRSDGFACLGERTSRRTVEFVCTRKATAARRGARVTFRWTTR